ncbi:hypothetical protein SAMN02800692_2604 [Luteibacter sp. UNC138MFCol5.1]|nr:hypothetical protein SAMN02800692_2604 [Luteibacter sp. UNC138MFCol5.1]
MPVTQTKASLLATPALPGDRPVSDAMLNAVAHDLHKELEGISKSLDHLAGAGDDKWLAAKMGFLGVLAGAGVTGLFGIILQSWRLKAEKDADKRRAVREMRKAERDFGLEAMANLQAFRTRQLNEFYGPFRVLLSQIRVLRDEFDHRLLASWKADGGATLKFEGGGRERRLVIKRRDVPARGFRLIDEMAFVKNTYPDLMSTVGEMVSTGDLLADHLHKNGGLLDPRSTWLGAHIAVYLAHQRVLKEIFERAQCNADASWVANYSTVYPRLLDLLIERDYKRLYHSQTRWSAKAARWAEGAD